MQNVPKIVRDRLQAATPAVNHPDADLLTAFAERSLPDRERTVVLEHLARCGDCREIVALALPAIESVQTTIRPSPSGWFTWPALRWGFVTAGVVAVASLGDTAISAASPADNDGDGPEATAPLKSLPMNPRRKWIGSWLRPRSIRRRSSKRLPPSPILSTAPLRLTWRRKMSFTGRRHACSAAGNPGCWRQRRRHDWRPPISRPKACESVPATEQRPESDSCSRASGVRQAARERCLRQWECLRGA